MKTRINKTKYAILGMLSFSPKSGYEIKQSIQRSTAFFWSESDGQLYPLLKQMTQEKLITFHEESTGNRIKKVYVLTENGQETLTNWLQQQPTTFNIRNEFLLQLFFGHNMEHANNIKKIREYQTALKQQLGIYSEIEKRIKTKSAHPTYLLLSLSYGQKSLMAEIDWCNDAIQLLENKDD